MSTRIPAEVFPPGEFLKEELEARNWSQVEFSEIIGKDTRLVYEIIGGKRAITPETALIFSEALGTSPEFWLNLESQYQLSKVRTDRTEISRKAKVYGRFPVREMVKRGWLEETKSVDVLEQQVKGFFGLNSLDDAPRLQHAAKKTNYDEMPVPQVAWLFRVRQIAASMIVEAYSADKLEKAVGQLSALLSAPEETRHVPRIMAECGVRFVVVESLPGAKIDGACFWLDKDAPVIGMTIVRDRIDNFWFVLRHEIEHILREHRKDGLIIDEVVGESDFVEAEIREEEDVANRAAANFCVPQDKLSGFIARLNPYFSETKVVAFAKTLGIHAGLVVGQLQRRLEKYSIFKQHQVKVRQFVTSAAVHDGWGQVCPVD